MFGWTYLDRSGEEVGRSRRFDDAEQAEEWIGSSWPELLEQGVEAVVLVDDEHERVLYRMGLGAGEA
jgi:hypothetical protein